MLNGMFWSDLEHEKSDFNYLKITLKHAKNLLMLGFSDELTILHFDIFGSLQHGFLLNVTTDIRVIFLLRSWLQEVYRPHLLLILQFLP